MAASYCTCPWCRFTYFLQHIHHIYYSICVSSVSVGKKNRFLTAFLLYKTNLHFLHAFLLYACQCTESKIVIALTQLYFKVPEMAEVFWLSFKKGLAPKPGLKFGWLTVLQKYSSGKIISWKTFFSLSTFPPSYICFYMLWLRHLGPSYVYSRADLHGHID